MASDWELQSARMRTFTSKCEQERCVELLVKQQKTTFLLAYNLSYATYSK